MEYTSVKHELKDRKCIKCGGTLNPDDPNAEIPDGIWYGSGSKIWNHEDDVQLHIKSNPQDCLEWVANQTKS